MYDLCAYYIYYIMMYKRNWFLKIKAEDPTFIYLVFSHLFWNIIAVLLAK